MVSRHLIYLKNSGILASRKLNQWVFYQIKEEVLDIVNRTTPEMVRKTYHVGSPAQIAAKIRPFTAAGADRHLMADVSSLLIAQDPSAAVEGMIEVSRLVKQG